MVEVITTDEFVQWFDGLTEEEDDSVSRSVRKLETFGVTLGHPDSSAIKGSRFAMRELRVQSHGDAIRIFYIFDPNRDAVLLLGATKRSDSFYETYIPIAEKIWRQYLQEEW